MAEVSSLFKIRGKVGNTVFCTMNGKTFARALAVNRNDPNTPKQQAVRSRFRVAVRFYQKLKETSLRDVLDVSAKGTRMNGFSLFMKMNLEAFKANGKIGDFSLLQFSAGKRRGVYELEAEVDAEDRVTLRWEADTWDGFGDADDGLTVVLLYGNRSFSPVVMEGIGAKRLDEKVTFPLTRRKGTRVHIYCFFGTPDRKAFSNTQYLKI